MTKKTMKILPFISFMLALTASAVLAQAPYQVKEGKLSIKGTSSLHDWESTVSGFEWSGDLVLADHKLTQLSNISVVIPVENIKSEHGRIMDNKTYDAFDSKKNPNITFKVPNQQITGQGTVDVKGSLTMAGATKPWTLRITYKALAGGDLQVTGSSAIKMTEFGMDPPTALMGTVKVADNVTVEFNLVLTPGKGISSRR